MHSMQMHFEYIECWQNGVECANLG